jgi:UDP-GlcNAc:undecaprenyl-phosphate/decaprenyl-phosphate GlcNAc-1-phosphate transferase
MITTELRIIIVFLVALFGALFVLPELAHIAKRIGLIDHPNRRKVHTSPQPLVGGIGIVIAATFSSLALVPITGLRGYFLGLSLLLLVGFLDDFKEVGHKQKFLAQIGATMLLIFFSAVSLRTFGDLLGIGNLDIPGGEIVIWCVTVFCIVGVINAINLIDGLDGLAGGVSFIAFFFFALHASFSGDVPLMLLNFALAGAVLGFLKYNWYPSVLFMGDAGSLCLGFSLGFMALALTQGSAAAMPPVAALLILAVPITDTLLIMSKRIINGSNPFLPDKFHLHHIFMRLGLSKLWTVKAILGLSFFMGALSLLFPLYLIPEYYLFAAFCLYFIICTVASFFILRLLRYSRRFKKKKPKQGEIQYSQSANG